MVALEEFITTTLQLILHAVMLVMAIWIYRVARTRASRLLLYASNCYTLARYG